MEVKTNTNMGKVFVPQHVSANHIVCFIDRLTGISNEDTASRLNLAPITVKHYAITCSTYLRLNDVNLSVYNQWQRALMPDAIRSLAIHLRKGTKEVLIKYMEGNGLWSKNINIQAVSLTASIPELKASINAEASHDPSVQAALADIQGALSDDPGALGTALDGTVIDEEGMMHVKATAPAPGVVPDVPEGSASDPRSPGAGGREIGSSLTSKNSEKKVNVDCKNHESPMGNKVPQSRGGVSDFGEPCESPPGSPPDALRNDIRNPESLDDLVVPGDFVGNVPRETIPDIRNDIRKKPAPVPKDLYTGLKVGENFLDGNGMKRKVTAVNPLECKLLRRKMRRGVNGHDRGKKTRRAKK